MYQDVGWSDAPEDCVWFAMISSMFYVYDWCHSVAFSSVVKGWQRNAISVVVDRQGGGGMLALSVHYVHWCLPVCVLLYVLCWDFSKNLSLTL